MFNVSTRVRSDASRRVKMQIIFRMCLSLYKYQSKGNRYRKRLTSEKQGNHKSKIYTRFTKPGNRTGNHQTTKGKERKKEETQNQLETRFKVATNTYVSVITLNVNEQNAPIKRQSGRLDKEQEPTICCLQEMCLTAKDPYRLKMRRRNKMSHTNRSKWKLQYSYQTKQTLK